MHFYSVPIRYWLLFASIIFLLLPHSSNLLYIGRAANGTSPLGGSCTTRNEWLWVSFVSTLIIIPHVRLDDVPSRFVPSVSIISMRPKISWFQLNFLWYAASLIGPFVGKSIDVEGMSLLGWIEHFGGKAAWPAMW